MSDEQMQRQQKRKAQTRWGQMKTERDQFFDWWRDLAQHHLPHRGKFLTGENDDVKASRNVAHNNRSLLARRTLAAGMMSGMTSPARPWFQLSTGDDDLDDSPAVKEWLYECTKRMIRVFSMSNLYNSLQSYYNELSVFATATLGVFEDGKDIIRVVTYTAGEYCIAVDGKDRCETFYREYPLTVEQLVTEFGQENLPKEVTTPWKAGKLDATFKVLHLVEPNDDRSGWDMFADDLPYRSVYYLMDIDHAAPLRSSGFNEKALLTARWAINSGECAYGTECPGMMSLGDTMTLQVAEKLSAKMLHRMADPALRAPTKMRRQLGSKTPAPGTIIFSDESGDVEELIKGHRPDLGSLEVRNEKMERRINEAYFVDLFRMLADTDRRQITAREVAEKHEEKLLQLGPVLERLHSELLDPLIARVFGIMMRQGLLPDIPEELEEVESLTVSYISVLAQAQKLVTLSAIESTVAFAAEMANIDPSARHRIDVDTAIEEYAEVRGANPALVRSRDDARKLAQQDAQAAQAAQAAEIANTASQTAKNMADVQPDGAAGGVAAVMREAGLA